MIFATTVVRLLGVPIHLGDLFIWGGFATIILTIILAGSRWLGLTRMSMSFLLGTVFTPDRHKAEVIGIVLHALNGWWLAAIYAMAFQSIQFATWWLGMGFGLVHALVVLLILTPLLPSVHPRMASERSGPTSRRQLEPPGFFALNYGFRTPLVTIAAHLLYGGVLGGAFQLVTQAGNPFG